MQSKGKGVLLVPGSNVKAALTKKANPKKKIPRLQGRKKIAACPTMTNQDRAVNTAGIVKDRKN